MKKEIVRKGIHTSLALGFVVLAMWVNKEVLLGLTAMLFILFSVARVLRFFHIARVPRVTFGELFFTVGVFAALQLSWPDIPLFQLSMLVLALSDPVAALVGIPFGKHTYTIIDEKRSFEGSTAFFSVTFLILILFGIPIYIAGIFSIILTLIEALSIRGSDNLTVPIVIILLFSLV